jgi:ubiquinone/menaquinone biosynthesis C-methylase UbiE
MEYEMKTNAQYNEYLKAIDKHFIPTFKRAYNFGRRGDEGLWRVLELSAVDLILNRRVDQPILDIGCGDGDVFEAVFGSSGNFVARADRFGAVAA